MPGSNFHFDISSDLRKHFDFGMELAFSNCPGAVATAYKITEKNGFVLSWKKPLISTDIENNWISLPYPMNLEAAKEFVWNWLKSVDFCEEPDHDGSNKKGFRIYNEQWGHIDRDFYAFVGVKPDWQEYHK